MKTQLEAEYERFSENITLAMEPLRKRLGQKLLEPTPIATNHFDEIATNLLAAAKQFPPENYCPWLLSSMQKSSPEKLRVTIEAAFARYEALAAQRQPNAAK